MENASKALEIAAGVVFAAILLSLIAYFFSTISAWPQSEEDRISTEQLTEFNLEYEVYEKNAMYGVDVISCLNKARSNNEKYVEGGAFLSGTKYGDSYAVDVYVNIKKPLTESIDIYYFNSQTGKEDLRVKGANINLETEQQPNPYFESIKKYKFEKFKISTMPENKAKNKVTKSSDYDKVFYTNFTYENVGMYSDSEKLERS